MTPATGESGGAKPVLRFTRIPKNSAELANYYLELAYRTENHIGTTRLPSLLMSLALGIFAAGATLRVYEDAWFKGAEFIGFALFAAVLLAAGVVVHVAELNLPRLDKRASIAAQNGSVTYAGDQTAYAVPTQEIGAPAAEASDVSGDDQTPTLGSNNLGLHSPKSGSSP